MANKEIQVESKVVSSCTSLTFLFGQAVRADRHIHFLLDKLRAVQKLVGEWRAEFPESAVAERCAKDLEALVIPSEPKRGSEPS